MPRLAAIIIRQKAKTANAGKNRVCSCFLCDAMVKIRPNGRTSDPDVIGALRYLDETIIIIDYEHEDTGKVAIHFPVLGYQISAL